MKNIVTIGGGTGSFTLLTGLKKYNINISAIVSMADDGGSTGRLRDELGVLPPGDVRQCLVALSDSTDTMRKLMNYRFEKGSLEGHNFGNILLSALEKIEGGFSRGLIEAARILNIKGLVIPVSDEKMNLAIELNNSQLLIGEKQLDHKEELREFGVNRVFLEPKVSASDQALKAIKKSDMIIIGPGDHYGSIVPNLLAEGISEAICKSKAKVVYNCNLTNKKGQTENFDLNDYVDSINSYLGKARIDFVIVPTYKPTLALRRKYEEREGEGSVVDFSNPVPVDKNYKVVRAKVLRKSSIKESEHDEISATRSFIRHDSDRLAKALMELLEMDEGRVIKKII